MLIALFFISRTKDNLDHDCQTKYSCQKFKLTPDMSPKNKETICYSDPKLVTWYSCRFIYYSHQIIQTDWLRSHIYLKQPKLSYHIIQIVMKWTNIEDFNYCIPTNNSLRLPLQYMPITITNNNPKWPI